MKRQPPAFACFLLLVPIAAFALVGCGAPNEPTTSAAGEAHNGHDHADGEHQGESGHDHSGWWCPEHGVPEGECTRCDSSLIAEFKGKEDWCDEHDRPETQCFRLLT